MFDVIFSWLLLEKINFLNNKDGWYIVNDFVKLTFKEGYRWCRSLGIANKVKDFLKEWRFYDSGKMQVV